MKEIKLFEVRDKGTCIPMCAVHVVRCGNEGCAEHSREDKILRRAGWNHERGIYMFHLGQDGMKVCYDPYTWGDRTRKAVHLYLQEYWDELEDGQLLDVRVILGETKEPCETEMGEIEAALAAAKSRTHSSDCAIYNSPALPAGPCDCGSAERKAQP